jgi:uncharacterized protein
MDSQPLNDAEFHRVTEVLSSFGPGCGMNLEQMDGFFAALICGPDNVLPSEYLPKIWGEGAVFSDQKTMSDVIHLITRHWNAICHTLQSGDVYLPLLMEDDFGVAQGNDWANGFLRGMHLRREAWTQLLNDDQNAGVLVPILALAHEHDPDPEIRPYKEPVSIERREKLIIGAAASVMSIYRYFREHRSPVLSSRNDISTFRRNRPKVGRNDPCPCGSGRKFKLCCGRITFH